MAFSLDTFSVSIPTTWGKRNRVYCWANGASLALRSSTYKRRRQETERPFSSRSILVVRSLLFWPSRLPYSLICSRKDLGVV
ncbi:hypothetical protein EYF80_008049 [Liparis tanakae]|uniref:Uncharacterized protein n=1 Tax=Liparis tanakae TaxID=230148 RepID=A0A4Z2IWH0_9TELE|nr:hypothetical protein EYF80_008049 [Liparis tanakae]